MFHILGHFISWFHLFKIFSFLGLANFCNELFINIKSYLKGAFMHLVTEQEKYCDLNFTTD